MAQNILLIVNPISGDINKVPIVKKIEKKIPENSNLEIFRTTGKNDYDNLKNNYDRVFWDTIIILGGDGTVKLVVKAFLNKEIVMAIIPAGSSNGLATDLEIPEKIDDAIDLLFKNQKRKIDVLTFSSHQFKQEISLHISDFGLNAELVKEYEDSNLRGKIGYAINVLPALFKTDTPFGFKIKTNGVCKEYNAVMLAIANGKKFGTGAIINPGSHMNDGVFEIIIFKNLSIKMLANVLYKRLEHDSESVEVITTKRAEIQLTRPIKFQIDGEFYGQLKSVEVEIIPKAIHIIAPPE